MATIMRTDYPPATISIDELAREIGVHRTTLYDQARMGTLPWPVVRIGKRILVNRKAFEAWQSERTPVSNSAA